MAERKSIRLEKQQINTIEDMVDRDIADNQSEAHRMLLNAGRGEYGYQTDGYTETLLKNGVENAAWLLTVAGMVGLTFTFAYPIPARVPSFAVMAFGVFLFPVAQALSDVEPKVSNRLKALLGGEKA
jgi:Arc/MetJ-type ribon-helix-helix transcriptional regulator